MIRRLAGAATICVLASAVVFAADFWEKKPFPTWSDKELQEITSDSPWARKLTLTPPDRGGGGGGGRRGGALEERLVPISFQRGGGGGGGRGPQLLAVIVMWRSALPMKEALVRSQIGLNGKVPAESQALLDRTEDAYVVTAGGLPAAMLNAAANMKPDSFLHIGTKTIGADDALAQVINNQLMLIYQFPRKDAVTLEDKDVELVSKVGGVEIKKKFSLKDMVYKGKIEL